LLSISLITASRRRAVSCSLKASPSLCAFFIVEAPCHASSVQQR
jgi:hypothetical protein